MTKVIRLRRPLPKHAEQIKISQDAQQIENKLNAKLIILVKSLQKLNLQIQPNILYNLDYREKITSSIRQAVERIYQIAGTYASEFTGREYFTTRTDLDTIEQLSLTYNDVFVSRLSRFVFASSEENPKQSIENIVNMTTATLTQNVMRTAIIAKSQQILNPITISAASETDISNAIDAVNVVYVWVTSQDDRVCPICAPHEGQAWAFNDYPDIPDIPDDTHPNCRCMIQLSEAIP